MLEFSARNEPARLDERIDDRSVGVADLSLVSDDALAFEAGRLVGKGAVLVDRIGNARVDPALLKQSRARGPELEVLAPMAGSGMDEARARIVRHMVAVKQRNDKSVALGVQGMRAGH